MTISDSPHLELPVPVSAQRRRCQEPRVAGFFSALAYCAQQGHKHFLGVLEGIEFSFCANSVDPRLALTTESVIYSVDGFAKSGL